MTDLHDDLRMYFDRLAADIEDQRRPAAARRHHDPARESHCELSRSLPPQFLSRWERWHWW